jgi:hypothetical protein
MKTSGWRKFCVLFCACALIPWAGAQQRFSGNANQDQRLDIGDVTTMANQLNSTATLVGPPAVFFDADQSGVFDLDDLARMVNVLLGLAIPKPLAGPGLGALASYWLRPPAPTAADARQSNTRSGLASFWFRTPAVTAADAQQSNTRLGLASFWFRQPDATAGDAQASNTRSALASFWFQLPAVSAADANQANVRSGVAAFWFQQPAPTLADANATNVFQTQAPSYLRQ